MIRIRILKRRFPCRDVALQRLYDVSNIIVERGYQVDLKATRLISRPFAFVLKQTARQAWKRYNTPQKTSD